MIPTCTECGVELDENEVEVGVCVKCQEPDEDAGRDR